MQYSALFFVLAVLPALPAAARTPACLPMDDGQIHASRDACIAAHVYDVVHIGATRFLDVCSPETPDAQCRFSVVSYGPDQRSVGDLDSYRGKDIEIRGSVQLFGQRYLMVLNNDGQFHQRPARFQPDPRLLNGFSAEESQPSEAPELKVNFHHKGRKLEHE